MELLGFAPYSRPSPSEVKAAYRRMVMESHPDRVPIDQKPQAESKFKQVVEAYSCLKDGRRFGNRMEVHVMRSGVPTGYRRSNKILVKAPFLLIICAAVSFGSYSASSEIFCFGKALEKQADYAGIFTCAIGGFPFKYLGLPLHYKKLCNADWKPAEEKVEKGGAAWQGALLSMGGRLIRTETCLSNVISHLFNFFHTNGAPLMRH
ncbi:Chaperone protein DnaJ [Triticum urartu]|uniref:Chaperone protein DnaJ n=1 Tax=Triticum urartu TaxID=4572 RepID=M7Z1E6_TRIUA|nr:Chaperone protein DnaJ [Triticum urartu]